MTRLYIREPREHYEERMRNTELYFLGEAPENECCPVCGEHDFFNFIDLSLKEKNREVRTIGTGCNVKTRVTGRELLDYLADEDNYPEHLNCAACSTSISFLSKDKIIPDEEHVHWTKEQFKEALDATFDGDMTKFIFSSSEDSARLYEYLESKYVAE